MTATVHIAMQADTIHVTLSNGELFVVSLDEVTTRVRSQNIATGDVTMPDKNDENAPTTGKRIAIYYALREQNLTKSNKYASEKKQAIPKTETQRRLISMTNDALA
jgi:hypothetical protein